MSTQDMDSSSSSMDGSSVPELWYRRLKPQGKVRRRIQDLRIPSSSYYDFIASRPTLDLSHNESTRLAADSLLSQGIEGYHEVLNAEGEVDFLSELEKIYILENGRDGSTADPGASDDQLESLSADCQSATQYPATSTDSDLTVELNSLKGVKRTDQVQDEPSFEIYFQSDSRAAGMKDLVREFIRKATMALAIVVDCFSDVELLCDLLEASRKRNVSVHLLLDHLNLNLFVNMWQDLKLNGKNFPKLSVRSVDGQTYCAKTGRKLTGQIAESFIITDWTEVLTGSYSFSWLSWQVHRSLAVLVKGSAVIPFHQEFHRLNSSSKPVPGFVTYVTVPHTLPLYIYTALHASQNGNTVVSKVKSAQTKWAWNEDARKTQKKEKIPFFSKPQSSELERNKDDTQPPHRAGTSAQMHKKSQQLHPKPLVKPALQNVSVGKPKHAVGAVCTRRGSQTNVEPLEKNPNQIQSDLNPLSQTHISYFQSQLSSLTLTTTAEKNVRVQESNPLHTALPTLRQHRTLRCQTSFETNSNLERCNVGDQGLFFQQRNRNRLIKPLESAAGQNTQSRQWYRPLNLKPKVDFLSDYLKVLSPSISQHKEVKIGLLSSLTHPRGHICRLQTKVSRLGTRRQDQPQRHNQPPLQSHPTTEALGSKSALTAVGTHLQHRLQSGPKLFSPGTGTKVHLQPHNPQLVEPPLRLKWIPQSQTARPRPVARHSSLGTTYGIGKQAGLRPFPSSINTLGRSKSMTNRHSAGLK